MHKTLVLHPQDETTDFLTHIYSNHKYPIVRNFEKITKVKLQNLISGFDRIIMLGHGSPLGLLSGDTFVIDTSFGNILAQKHCVCIWCHAHEFVKSFKIKGFHTGMFISEMSEANLESVSATEEQIQESNSAFAKIVGNYLNHPQLFQMVYMHYNLNSPVAIYNRERLCYS